MYKIGTFCFVLHSALLFYGFICPNKSETSLIWNKSTEDHVCLQEFTKNTSHRNYPWLVDCVPAKTAHLWFCKTIVSILICSYGASTSCSRCLKDEVIMEGNLIVIQLLLLIPHTYILIPLCKHPTHYYFLGRFWIVFLWRNQDSAYYFLNFPWLFLAELQLK